MSVQVRLARPEEAQAIGAIQQRAWARAYGDFVPPEAYDDEALERRVGVWREAIAARRVQVFDLDGQIAGYVAVGPVRDGSEPAHVGELTSLYVDPPAQGAGVGRALLVAADEALAARDVTEAILWVFTENGLARSIYERRGWVQEPDAVSERLHGADWWAPAVRYRRTL